MATSIGFPKIGKDLSRFVENSPNKHRDSCFSNNATLMIFAASWAYEAGVEIDENEKVDCIPDRIGWETIQNNKLDKICLAIAIAHVGPKGVTNNSEQYGSIASDRLAKIIEKYSYEGFLLLLQEYVLSEGATFLDDLVDKLTG